MSVCLSVCLFDSTLFCYFSVWLASKRTHILPKAAHYTQWSPRV